MALFNKKVLQIKIVSVYIEVFVSVIGNEEVLSHFLKVSHLTPTKNK